MLRAGLLTITSLVLAGAVISLLIYLVLVLKAFFSADRVEARRVKREADDAVYELERVRRLKSAKKP
jgi:hypothetical protein